MKRKCPICEKPVAEDDICECLKKRINEKRDKEKEEEKSNVNVLVVNNKDVVVFHVPDSHLAKDNHLKELEEIFEGITVLVVSKSVDINIVKKEDKDA